MAAVSSAPTAAAVSRPRMLFIDNLRWTMIILVISMHAADTYSPLGNWYYVDRRPMSAAALFTFAAWQMYLQSFFMGLLFFIAGFFVPASFDRKGPLRFVARTYIPARCSRVVLHVRPGANHGILLLSLLEFDRTHILRQRVGQAHSQWGVSPGKRASVVLSRAADFFVDVCCVAGLAPNHQRQ